MPDYRVIALILTLFGAGPALAGEAEIQAAQSTIDKQLQAFLADDGAAAYSHASPTIKKLYPTVGAFMTMVERGYAPVRQPQSYAFGAAKKLDRTTILQKVHLVGPDGRNYVAVYTLELQADGVFRISGCSLRASNALST
ncbi:DUF4864 domain-containing protein [Nitratireductor alexandrii]|uniref:DUF4864 domain-containing protein n=1 Tax=Nitratireductor alexandrii TaxID=2448161 RepID=UPI000FD72809|nr:DUF4864 domain-containing protein [Nitratireductor alexandrii]